MLSTWEGFLRKACKQTGDNFAQLKTTMTPDEMAKPFDSGFGRTEGCSFTAWGEKYVYFPIGYDGAERVGWVPRNPCDEASDHHGGGQL